jgi:hypothetical protein
MSTRLKAFIAAAACALLIQGSSYGNESDSELIEVAKIRKDPLPAYWEHPPPIRLCTDSGVTRQRLERALDFWRRLGYEFGSVIIEDTSYACATGGWAGEITILLFTQEVIDSVHLAVTRTRRNTDTNKIVQIQIYINRYGAEKLLVLEHEIGHALGWSHRRERYHLMNENWREIGHETNGLTFRDYQHEISKIKQSSQ